MKKSKEFDNILEECLERVLTRGETVEQCLASYPEQAAELEPLLQTALLAKGAVDIKPRPEFRARARYQFQSALREMELKRERRFFGWQPRWATVVIAVVVLLVAGSGTVMAASNSMPDGPLYPVKLATERIQVALTPSDLGKAELYVKLADKRVAEIARMADKGKAEQVEKTAERFNAHLVAMASLAAPREREVVPQDRGPATFEAPAPGATTGEVAPEAVIPTPRPAAEEAPPPAVAEPPAPAVGKAPPPAIRRVPPPTVEKAPPPAVERAPRPAVEETPVRAPREVPEPPGITREGRGGGGSDVREEAGIDKKADLRDKVLRRAANNIETLREALERAPESARPALRKAIADAVRSYQQALRALR